MGGQRAFTQFVPLGPSWLCKVGLLQLPPLCGVEAEAEAGLGRYVFLGVTPCSQLWCASVGCTSAHGAQPAHTHSPLPAQGHLEPHSPFSFSPNMVRKTVKLMGPGASFTMASSSSFFTLMRPVEERETPRSTVRVRADPVAGSPGE